LQLYIQRVPFDPVYVAELETEVKLFLQELEQKIQSLLMI